MNFLSKLGPLFAMLGMAVCLVSFLFRVTGHATCLGYETLSYFVAGLGLMVAACTLKLYEKNQSL